MKINFLLLTIITAAITSCSTSYKTGQTPDDVYYSPARFQSDNVKRDENKNVQDNSVYTTPEDREIRRRVHNRRYRRYDDQYNYPYGYNGYPSVYGNPKTGVAPNTSTPRKTNLGAYTPNTTTPDSTKSINPKSGMQNSGATTNGSTNPVRTFGNPVNSSVPNNGSAVGNLIRKVFNGDNSSNNSNNNYNNANSNNSSSTRSFDRSSNNNNSNTNNSTNNSDTKSAPATNNTSVPVRTFKKDN